MYLPALVNREDGFLPSEKGRRSELWDSPNWMDARLKGTPAYYPNALMAYPGWHNIRHPGFPPPEAYIFGDSGGYSVMTLGLQIDPRDVLRWQFRTCTAGCILDVPPLDKHGHHVYREGLAATVRNTKAVRALYEDHRASGGKFKWWGVAHGWTAEETLHWLNKVRSVYAFDDEGEGWAFKPRPNITAVSTASVLHAIAQVPEVKRGHFLMTTGYEAVTVLHVLGPLAGLEFVSYDSTTFVLVALQRGIFERRNDGLEWTQSPHKERGDDRHLRDFLLEKCPCVACDLLRADVNKYSDLLDKNQDWTSYWVFRFAYHNLVCALEVFAARDKVAREMNDPHKALLALLGKKRTAEVWRAFEGRASVASSPAHSGSILDFLK